MESEVLVNFWLQLCGASSFHFNTFLFFGLLILHWEWLSEETLNFLVANEIWKQSPFITARAGRIGIQILTKSMLGCKKYIQSVKKKKKTTGLVTQK